MVERSRRRKQLKRLYSTAIFAKEEERWAKKRKRRSPRVHDVCIDLLSSVHPSFCPESFLEKILDHSLTLI